MDQRRRQLLACLSLAPAALLAERFPALGDAERPPEAAPAANDIVLEAEAGGGAPRPSFRYGAASPGPILRVRRNVSSRIILRNRLIAPTSLDLHGVHVPPPLGGGGPMGGSVAAGHDAEISFTPPDSGTFWFHPWILDQDDATAGGLAGVLLVEEDAPPDVDADKVLVLSDRSPSDPRLPDAVAGASLSERLWIDGGPWPSTGVLAPGSRMRLRIVNASTQTAVAIACSGTTPFVIAIDGQPSELFKPLGDAVPVGPGARFDLMFDLPRTSGSEVRLGVRGAEPGARPETALVFGTDGEARPARPPIGPLPPNPLLPRAIPLEAANRAQMTVQMKPAAKAGLAAQWTVNGVPGPELSRKPLFTARRGTPVTLGFKNASPVLTAFRVHGFAMRLLHDLDDGWEPYWRDSVLVPAGVTHHAAFLADRPGRWLIESPFFAQAAGGLRGWFEVT